MYATACINHPLHLSLCFLLLARSCLLLYQRCSLKAGTPSIFTDLKFLRLSPPNSQKKPSLCSPLHIHTYINTSLWRQRCWGRRGLGIKITLNSKQRIVGPWQVDGLSASHTCFRITPLWHANHQTGRAALGERSRCVSQVPAMQRIWSREVWYTNCELVDDTVWVIRGYRCMHVLFLDEKPSSCSMSPC